MELSEALALCQYIPEISFVMETSAKDNTNIKDIFYSLANELKVICKFSIRTAYLNRIRWYEHGPVSYNLSTQIAFWYWSHKHIFCASEFVEAPFECNGCGRWESTKYSDIRRATGKHLQWMQILVISSAPTGNIIELIHYASECKEEITKNDNYTK